MTKAELRKTALQTRKSITVEQRAHASMVIFERAHKHPAFQLAKRVHVYHATEDEVPTSMLMEYAWSTGKDVFVPVTGSEHRLFHVHVTRDTQWESGEFGIAVPVDRTKAVPASSFMESDVVIVPVVAFDSMCNRLGYGRGYYDRFLSQTTAFRLGIAFECQKCPVIPVDETDVPLSAIATEERWYVL